MPAMKNSFLKIKSVFLDTRFGKVSLELSTDRAKVLAIDNMGIKETILLGDVKASSAPFVLACREANPNKFSTFCALLEKI